AVAFARVQDAPLSVDEVMAAVRHDRAGAVALFVGQVRDHDGGRGVVALDYSAHPSADSVAATIAARYAALPGIERIALAHRVGALVVGDLAIVAAVSSAHRGAAFQTCADLVEDVKAHLPIWKHQQFEDGTQEWVGIE
ncbi:MAG: molybdenum cofactor biosynthesis protein MoaE, partial [Candidatus Phosphoribacter baldrii]